MLAVNSNYFKTLCKLHIGWGSQNTSLILTHPAFGPSVFRVFVLNNGSSLAGIVEGISAWDGKSGQFCYIIFHVFSNPEVLCLYIPVAFIHLPNI